MAVRDIYLKIETLSGYSPVEPDDHVTPPIVYRRDCMRNMGHEDGTIPVDEVNARRRIGERRVMRPHTAHLVVGPGRKVGLIMVIPDASYQAVPAAYLPSRAVGEIVDACSFPAKAAGGPRGIGADRMRAARLIEHGTDVVGADDCPER